MKFKIEVFQNGKSIFANVLNENDEELFVSNPNNSPYEVVKEACNMLNEMMMALVIHQTM